MSKNYRIAIVGATGVVGETLLEILAQRDFPVSEIYPIASSRSVEKTVQFKQKTLSVLNLSEFNFSQVDLALFTAGSAVSKEYVPIATQHNAIVIDNTSAFRQAEDVPLVIPEVNPQRIGDFQARGIIASPNCSAIQLLVPLKPLQQAAGLKKVIVSTYQSVSGTGRRAITELVSQTTELLNGRPVEPRVYPEQIAFNLIPQIDRFDEQGHSKEEMKLIQETHKILEDPNIEIHATAVRVPVIYGHSESVYLEMKRPLSASKASKILAQATGVKVFEKESYPTPIRATGHDAVFVGRIRQDLRHSKGLNLWIVSDNIRKGAALNMIQIAEYLVKNVL